MHTTLLWHHEDLRLKDNLALCEALKQSSHLLPLFIYTPEMQTLGSASKWWLHKSLCELLSLYQERGTSLFFLEGDPLTLIPPLIQKLGIDKVCWNLSFLPSLFQTQQRLQFTLQQLGVLVYTFNSNHLTDPREIFTKSHAPYGMFTPFYKKVLPTLSFPEHSSPLKHTFPPPVKTTKGLLSETTPPLSPCAWHLKLHRHWKPGSTEGETLAKNFVTKAPYYETARDFTSLSGTSTLSPYLHFGDISPYRLWRLGNDSPSFQRQLIWREFATYLLFHHPHMSKENWNPKFDAFLWDRSSQLLKKWQQGKTGYPLIDAGMRQLWETGWMHNRVRMVVASFLTKDLLLHWKNGEKWFWDTLVDADRANNVLGWQWVAGSGPDAAPYFRIFNPILQSKTFDPEGIYIKTYVPELKGLPAKWIHAPWLAPAEFLEKGKIVLGKTYPYPIVDHESARKEALARYHRI